MSTGVNRQSVILMIQACPPPRPACFTYEQSWRDWLVQAHLSGLRIVRVIDLGKSSGNRQTSRRLLPTEQIAYCEGCTIGHQRSMQEQGRCQPSAVRLEAEEA